MLAARWCYCSGGGYPTQNTEPSRVSVLGRSQRNEDSTQGTVPADGALLSQARPCIKSFVDNLIQLCLSSGSKHASAGAVPCKLIPSCHHLSAMPGTLCRIIAANSKCVRSSAMTANSCIGNLQLSLQTSIHIHTSFSKPALPLRSNPFLLEAFTEWMLVHVHSYRLSLAACSYCFCLLCILLLAPTTSLLVVGHTV